MTKTFHDAAEETANPVPFYAYPKWFSSLGYCINFLKSSRQAVSNQKYSDQALEEAGNLFNYIFEKELRTLSHTALEMKLIDSPLIFDREGDQVQSQPYEKLTREEQLKEKEKKHALRAAFLDQIDKIIGQVGPLLNPTKSKFYKNTKMIAELFGLTPLECEVLALHANERIISRIVMKEARDEDEIDYTKFYAAALTKCLTGKGSDDLRGGSEAGIIEKQLFHGKGSLIESGLLSSASTYIGNVYFVVDDEIGVILQSDTITESSLLEQFIGKREMPKLKWDVNFKYIPWNNEIINYLLGALHRDGTLGKSVLLEGEPGSGKSTGVPAMAVTVENIMRRYGASDFEMPVYVIGVGVQNKAPVNRQQKNGDRDGQANNATDADIRKLLRARFLLAKFGRPAVLVVEEADGIVATLVAEKGMAITRAQRNYILEHSPVPTFYISNHPERFDAAAKRRFIDYKMDKPPQEVRVDMIVEMAAKLGLTVRSEDAITVAAHYEFAPGVIESALLLLRDYKCGQAIAGGKPKPEAGVAMPVVFDELKMTFERKQVGLIGTNLKLIEKLKVPSGIDTELYFLSGITDKELLKIVSGADQPKMWLFAGLPSTEVTELALYAAKQKGKETEIIDLKSLDANFQARLETAVTYKRPIVIVGAESLFGIYNLGELEAMPAIKALKNHVKTAEAPVYIVAHESPQNAPAAIKYFFSGEGCGFAGFNLAIADQLLGMINKLSGQNFEYELTDFLGLACAGPADVRKVLAKLNGSSNSLPKIAEALDRIVPHAVTREHIEQFTGIRVADNPLTYH